MTDDLQGAIDAVRGNGIPQPPPLPSSHANERSLKDAASILTTDALRSRGGRILASLFVVFEIYNTALIPVITQVFDLQKTRAEMEIARQVPDNAGLRQPAESATAAAKAKIRLAEARNAAEQARADADKMEAEARKSIADAEAARMAAQSEIAKIKKDRAVNEESVVALFTGKPLPDFLKH